MSNYHNYRELFKSLYSYSFLQKWVTIIETTVVEENCRRLDFVVFFQFWKETATRFCIQCIQFCIRFCSFLSILEENYKIESLFCTFLPKLEENYKIKSLWFISSRYNIIYSDSILQFSSNFGRKLQNQVAI